MDATRKLKLVAAIGAIMQFESENTASVQVAAPAPAAPSYPAPPLWGMAGRQDSMLTRSLWQRRIGRAV